MNGNKNKGEERKEPVSFSLKTLIINLLPYAYEVRFVLTVTNPSGFALAIFNLHCSLCIYKNFIFTNAV